MKKIRFLKGWIFLLALILGMTQVSLAEGAGIPAVTDEVIQQKDQTLDIDATYPVVSGTVDAALSENINAVVKGEVDASIQTVTEAAKADSEGGVTFYAPYGVLTSYEVKRNDGEYLSIVMTVYTDVGGAHGEAHDICINANNVAGGTMLKLGDLFAPGTDYIAELNAKVADWIAQDEYMATENSFETVREDQWFYLTGSQLVLIFGEYEIGPYSYGMPECAIPLSELDGITIPASAVVGE